MLNFRIKGDHDLRWKGKVYGRIEEGETDGAQRGTGARLVFARYSPGNHLDYENERMCGTWYKQTRVVLFPKFVFFAFFKGRFIVQSAVVVARPHDFARIHKPLEEEKKKERKNLQAICKTFADSSSHLLCQMSTSPLESPSVCRYTYYFSQYENPIMLFQRGRSKTVDNTASVSRPKPGEPRGISPRKISCKY